MKLRVSTSLHATLNARARHLGVSGASVVRRALRGGVGVPWDAPTATRADSVVLDLNLQGLDAGLRGRDIRAILAARLASLPEPEPRPVFAEPYEIVEELSA